MLLYLLGRPVARSLNPVLLCGAGTKVSQLSSLARSFVHSLAPPRLTSPHSHPHPHPLITIHSIFSINPHICTARQSVLICPAFRIIYLAFGLLSISLLVWRFWCGGSRVTLFDHVTCILYAAVGIRSRVWTTPRWFQL